jgi:MFS family permease
MSVALQQEAWLVGVKLVLRMISGPILGAMCDQYGRKSVLMLSIGGFTLACLLMYIACIQNIVPPLVVLTVAMVVQGITTAFGLCFKGMVADACKDTERAKGFVVLEHVDVLSRGFAIVFVIAVQKAQVLRYDRLCLAAVVLGSALLFGCHRCVHETLHCRSPVAAEGCLPAAATNGKKSAIESCHSNGKAVNGKTQQSGLLKLFAFRKPEFAKPFHLLLRSTFLQLRLLQMLLFRLADGWESVQDSFVISVLGWGPGDWDLYNVPISSGRELFGFLASGVMVNWAADAGNSFWYLKATRFFHCAMAGAQIFAPWTAAFLLIPRYLLAFLPGDGGADQVFFQLAVRQR